MSKDKVFTLSFRGTKFNLTASDLQQFKQDARKLYDEATDLHWESLGVDIAQVNTKLAAVLASFPVAQKAEETRKALQSTVASAGEALRKLSKVTEITKAKTQKA